MTVVNASQLLEQGREALERGEWAAAREVLQQAVDADASPEAHEELGTALWWLDDQA